MVNVKLSPYKSIEVETNTGKAQILSQGDKVRFITEDEGELKQGVIVNFKGSKPEKVEIEMIPENCKHRETWHILEMQEGSLKLVVDGEEENDEEE
jgi:hypothetical protein